MLAPQKRVVKLYLLSYDEDVFRKLFLVLFIILGSFLMTPPAYACSFTVPTSVVAQEPFPLLVNDTKQGLSYTLNYTPTDSQLRTVPGQTDSPKLAEGTTLTFNGSIPSRGTYKLFVSGTNRVNASDSCDGNGSLQVTGRWAITSAAGCTEVPTGGFATKEECDAAFAKANPTPTPPPGPCGNGEKCPTAFGDIQTDPSGFIKSIFGIILSLAGGIAIILIMISGYRLMSSQGNPEKVQAAREQLTSAIVGLLFIIFSVTILQIIGVDILHIPGLTR